LRIDAAKPPRNSQKGIAGTLFMRYQSVSMTTHTADIGIAEHLRQWRDRRRVSQLELALQAGTTQRYVSFIERGRSLPGRGMIVRLAEALEIPLRERNEMLLAAGYAPAYPQTDLDDPHLDPIRGALERVLDGHLPYPAVLTDRVADLVSANHAFTALVEHAPPSLREPRTNLGRVLLHPEGLGSRIINMAEWGRHVIDGLRRKSERHPDASLDRLIDELEGYVPPRSHHPSPLDLGFAVPLRLRAEDGDSELTLLTTLTHFATAIDVAVSELTLEAFLPADEVTARHFQTSQANNRLDGPSGDGPSASR
jgi:transcriptional regulator with XRE-family HTH domain